MPVHTIMSTIKPEIAIARIWAIGVCNSLYADMRARNAAKTRTPKMDVEAAVPSGARERRS